MGHIAHLRKQFKSINTYDYIITLIKRRKNPLFTLWEFNCSSFEQTWITFIHGCIVPSLVKIGPVILEKKSKIGKVYRQTAGQTDRQTTDDAIRKAQLSFQLRWAKMMYWQCSKEPPPLHPPSVTLPLNLRWTRFYDPHCSSQILLYTYLLKILGHTW